MPIKFMESIVYINKNVKSIKTQKDQGNINILQMDIKQKKEI